MNTRAKQVILAVVMLIFAISSTGVAAEKYQWKYAGDEDGCRIYTSSVAGKDYIAAKVTCVIAARMDVIGVILRDIAGYPEWMHDSAETRMLKVEDDENDVLIFWMHQHVALFKDRDMVLKSRTVCRNEKGQCFIYANSTNEMTHDSGNGYVRMPSFSSLFVLEWMDEKNTRVTFLIDPDLGRGIPAAAANGSIRAMPLKSLKKMMEMARQKKYIEAAKTSKYARRVEEYQRSAKR